MLICPAPDGPCAAVKCALGQQCVVEDGSPVCVCKKCNDLGPAVSLTMMCVCSKWSRVVRRQLTASYGRQWSNLRLFFEQ